MASDSRIDAGLAHFFHLCMSAVFRIFYIETNTNIMAYRDGDLRLIPFNPQEIKDQLKEAGITSPDIGKYYQLRTDPDTIFFFKRKYKLLAFQKKYYDKKTKKYNLENQFNKD